MEANIPINRLLGQADALISDYSSVAVDIMVLDRPTAFMLEDVCCFVEEVASGRDTTGNKRQILGKKMHKYCDDSNCRRILVIFSLN